MSSAATWISTEFLEEALKEHFHDNGIQINEFTTKAAIPIGENYTSDLIRSSITYKTSKKENKETTISVIIKCAPRNEMMNNLVRQLNLFETEAIIYTTVLPMFRDILDNEKLAPNCIYYTKQPQPTIIFEDLSKEGFQMSTRTHGLDLEHCLLVVKKLAHFHAASLVLHAQQPDLIEKFENGPFRDRDYNNIWILNGMKTLIKVSSKWKGFEVYSEKLSKILDKTVTKTLNAGRKNPEGFNVLNHGDAWINNFMFLFTSDKKPVDLRFVDLQLCKYSSPALDLQYFWATSPNLEIKKHHWDTVFSEYYSQLVSVLRLLKYPLANVPSKEKLQKDWTSRAFYGLATAVTVLPLVTAPKHEKATFDDFLNNDEEGGFQDNAFKSDLYRENMEYLLPFYDSLGVFNNE